MARQIRLALGRFGTSVQTVTICISDANGRKDRVRVRCIVSMKLISNGEIGMPEIAIYNSPDMNASSVGMKKNHLFDQVTAFGIWPSKGRVADLFRSHPAIEDRIAALRNL